MAAEYLEAGEIVNTHGVRGEVKIVPWTDTPGFLAGFKHLYIDGSKVCVESARVHKGCVIAALEGVTGVDRAAKMKHKVVCIDRADAKLEEGVHFVADLIGLRAIDAESGVELGSVEDVLKLPSGEVYVIHGEREILVPAVPEFVIEKNPEAGYIRLRLIEGM